MSNINRSNDVSRIKDYYTQRENDLQTKHRQTIEQSQKAHEEEVGRIKEESKNEIDSTITRMKEKLSEKDLKHQEEIEALRAMYQKKLEESKRS